MNILVIDGQGGQLGSGLIRSILSRFHSVTVRAVGTNATATAAMLKAGAVQGATGENPVLVACRRADIIIGPIGIVIADALFGEITPKTTATLYSESMALKFAKPIYLLMQVLTPVIFIVDKLSLAVLLLLHIDPNKKQEAITEEELRTIVEVSHEEGVIESDEKKMIYNVFDFGDSVARDIMVPRIDMTFIDVNSTFEEVLEIFREEKYTRYPVFEETTDNVIGIVNIKDLILLESDKEFCLRDHLREPMYTYEFKKTAELMVELRKTLNNIAIVLDEYGATAGLITMEDMLEEIVGEIRDEYDEDEEDLVKKLNATEFAVDAAMKLDDLNDQIGLHLESEDYDSIGGFVIGLLDHLPEEGEEVIHENLRLVVDKVERNRIETIHIYMLDEEEMKEIEDLPDELPEKE